MKFEIGKTYVFSVPPAWILTGKVVDVDSDSLTVDECVYIESVADGVASPAIGLHADPTEAVTRSYRLPDGGQIRKDAVLMLWPCDVDMSPLHAAAEAKAIRGKR